MIKTIKLRKHSDERGQLLSNVSEEIMLKSKHFFLSKSIPGAIRGNHYHEQKTEWFCVVQGECEIHVKDIVDDSTEIIKVTDKDGLLISMVPGKAHAIKNTGNSELILLALINEPFDPKKPDTIPYHVI